MVLEVTEGNREFKMSERLKPDRLKLGLIVLISVAPLLVAWLAYSNARFIAGRDTMNYGNLVVPPVPVRDIEAEWTDPGDLFDSIRGRWVLIHPLADGKCDEACSGSLISTAKIRLMMNKDLMRIARLLVSNRKISADLQGAASRHGGKVMFARLDNRFINRLISISGSDTGGGSVFLVDPLGNLMMWYPPGFDPYGMHKDLKRLLSVSQIG